MSRREITLALACLTSAAPVAALAGYDVPKHLAMFDRYCRPALLGLDKFTAIVAAPGPQGERVFSVSPDGHYITAKTGIDGFLVSASFVYGPGRVTRFCQVEFMEGVGSVRPRASTEQSFLALAPKGQDVTITGGPTTEELPAIGSFAAAGVGNIASVRSQYTLFGATEPPGSTMSAYIGDNIFLLNAMVIAAR